MPMTPQQVITFLQAQLQRIQAQNNRKQHKLAEIWSLTQSPTANADYPATLGTIQDLAREGLRNDPQVGAIPNDNNPPPQD